MCSLRRSYMKMFFFLNNKSDTFYNTFAYTLALYTYIASNKSKQNMLGTKWLALDVYCNLTYAATFNTTSHIICGCVFFDADAPYTIQRGYRYKQQTQMNIKHTRKRYNIKFINVVHPSHLHYRYFVTARLWMRSNGNIASLAAVRFVCFLYDVVVVLLFSLFATSFLSFFGFYYIRYISTEVRPFILKSAPKRSF